MLFRSSGVALVGVASAEAIGLPNITAPPIVCAGIGSAEAFGSPVVILPDPVSDLLHGGGLRNLTQIRDVFRRKEPAQALPPKAIPVKIAPSPVVNAGGVQSGERAGAPRIGAALVLVSVSSQEKLGKPEVSLGPIWQDEDFLMMA